MRCWEQSTNVSKMLVFRHNMQVRDCVEVGIHKRCKKLCSKINRECDNMANVGIEPKTFALLARRSNQLS